MDHKDILWCERLRGVRQDIRLDRFCYNNSRRLSSTCSVCRQRYVELERDRVVVLTK